MLGAVAHAVNTSQVQLRVVGDLATPLPRAWVRRVLERGSERREQERGDFSSLILRSYGVTLNTTPMLETPPDTVVP
jgi:FPC/CPF motif-containing protein YcgG